MFRKLFRKRRFKRYDDEEEDEVSDYELKEFMIYYVMEENENAPKSELKKNYGTTDLKKIEHLDWMAMDEKGVYSWARDTYGGLDEINFGKREIIHNRYENEYWKR